MLDPHCHPEGIYAIVVNTSCIDIGCLMLGL